MRISRKALLYDIANMAYVIADTGFDEPHILHQVRDVCEEGNIDRVNRILGLCYARVLSILLPLISRPVENKSETGDTSDTNQEGEKSGKEGYFEICFQKEGEMSYLLTPERKLKIKELIHEYMVSKVLWDWLEITYPVAADVWKDKTIRAFDALRDSVGGCMTVRRRVPKI